MKIDALLLQNYESHTKTAIPLGGITAIIGPNGSGKSGIWRALRWLVYDEPDGDRCIRFGEKFVSVGAEFADGTRLFRERGRTDGAAVNRYSVARDGEITNFDNFTKDGVPPEVQKLTGASYMTVPGEKKLLELNLAMQKVGDFLVYDRPSYRGSLLNAFVGVDKVDEAASDLQGDIRGTLRDIKAQEAEVARLEAELEGYTYVDRYRELTDSLGGALDRMADADRRNSRFVACRDRLEDFLERGRAAKVRYDRIAAFPVAAELVQQMQDGFDRLGELVAAQRQLESLETRIDRNERLLKALDDVSFVDPAQLQAAQERLARLSILSARLDESGRRVEVKQAELDRETVALDEAVEAYVAMVEELGVCPLCFQKADPEEIKRHLQKGGD